ncbi:cobalamin biosynthesis protein CbiX [Herbaspirillum hiltneri N3]|uniref:Cobalamin biosynthesis protein CbiX n=1 Tax=Herbaspirillum hiltneri N3 TaxID=1262470 RepID=A0ABM5V2T6_9BURK|nr:CbiX/SirB N-terminal domain-containing protein [Herbaspirillum hiltneri]AKZ63816.1 cobalamin biosynthesis protein CbiX [Herbaspirillum hiltneri N3]
MTKKSLILFAHGARDPNWAEPFRRLRALTQAGLPDVAVELAFLELMTPDLPQLAAQQIADGAQQVTIVPVFLGQGGHVRRDLPVLIEQLRRDHPGVAFQVAAAAGEDDGVLQALAHYCVSSSGR